MPKRLAILGGGVIGVEFASIFAHFGTEVTIVEMLDHLIPMEDEDASKELERAFKKRKIAFHLGARATRIDDSGGAATLHFEGKDGASASVEADLVLVATGRGPRVRDIGLEVAGVEYDPRRGVDRRSPHAHERRATSTPSATLRASTSSPTRPSARARSRPRTRSATTRRSTTRPCPGASTPIPRSPRSA